LRFFETPKQKRELKKWKFYLALFLLALVIMLPGSLPVGNIVLVLHKCSLFWWSTKMLVN